MTAGALEAGANPGDAVDSLEEKTGEDMVRVGNRFALTDRTHISVRLLNETAAAGRGRYLRALVAEQLTARFSAVCAGGTVRATLTTWSKVPMGVNLKCGLTEHLDGAAREAEHRACAA